MIKLASAQETVIAVRTKAVWALANLCDYTSVLSATTSSTSSSSLNSVEEEIKVQPSNRPYLYELIPHSAFLLLIRSLIESVNENEKIAANAVRALGNILKWIPFINNSADTNYIQLWCEIVEILLAKLVELNKTSVKTRWNCCYAIGNLVKNPHLPQILNQNQNTMKLLGKAFQCLLSSLETNNNTTTNTVNASNSPTLSSINHNKLPTKSEIKVANNNFKVRINSVVALSSPLSYSHYGIYFCKILNELLDYYLKVESLAVSNPREKTYRTTLKTQLTSSILLLLNKLNPTLHNSDLNELLINRLSMLGRLLFEERITIEKEIRTTKSCS